MERKGMTAVLKPYPITYNTETGVMEILAPLSLTSKQWEDVKKRMATLRQRSGHEAVLRAPAVMVKQAPLWIRLQSFGRIKVLPVYQPTRPINGT